VREHSRSSLYRLIWKEVGSRLGNRVRPTGRESQRYAKFSIVFSGVHRQ